MNHDRNMEGDLILIHHKEKPVVYARIEAIEPDIKKNWYRVTLLLLTIPAQRVTWILREEYINGAPFTMGGEPMILKGLSKIPVRTGAEGTGPPTKDDGPGRSSKVISLKDRKKS